MMKFFCLEKGIVGVQSYVKKRYKIKEDEINYYFVVSPDFR